MADLHQQNIRLRGPAQGEGIACLSGKNLLHAEFSRFRK